MTKKTWHTKHKETYTFGDKLADTVAKGMGSWKFILWQSFFVILWMLLNVVGFIRHWDVYPFILLNLIFSTQAAYAAPIIMMAQNRQAGRDRIQAEEVLRRLAHRRLLRRRQTGRTEDERRSGRHRGGSMRGCRVGMGEIDHHIARREQRCGVIPARAAAGERRTGRGDLLGQHWATVYR